MTAQPFSGQGGADSTNSVLRTYERYARHLPPRLAATLDMLLPSLRQSFGGPFNGQAKRFDLIRQLFDSVSFVGVVETGTYRGTSTAAFLELTTARIATVELDPRFAAYARRRFRNEPRVTVVEGDSRAFLEQLATDLSFPREGVFFYLDAHWYHDLPLFDEVKLICKTWKESVVLIDDFRVPSDSGYGFDDYGGPNRLTLHNLDLDRSPIYFPTAPSLEETGARRGCAVIPVGPSATRALDRVAAVRRWSHAEA